MHIRPYLLTSTALVVLSLSAVMAQAAPAVPLEWTGAFDDNWSNSGNWSTGATPTAADDATIARDTTVEALYGGNARKLTVGSSSAAKLDVLSAFSTGAGSIGEATGTSGEIDVSNSNGRWAVVSGSTMIGNAGNGTLHVQTGGQFLGGVVLIGTAASGSGSVSVNGTSTFNSGVLTIGDAGHGAFEVTAAGTARTAGTVVANQAGSSGSLSVTGGSSSLTVDGDLTIGNAGEGQLTIATGAAVSAHMAVIGQSASNASSSATISGSGSTLTTAATLTVGQAGSAQLNIFSGATVFSNGGAVGQNSIGKVTVGGSGSTWTTGDITIGGNRASAGVGGSGTLDISTAGQVSSQSASLGDSVGSSGLTTVDGSGSLWSIAEDAVIGGMGAGEIKVTGAGTVQAVDAMLGGDASGSGIALVNGGGSTWAMTGAFHDGYSGSGNLQVLAGASISDQIGFIGTNAGSTGTAFVKGDGSIWTNTQSLHVGREGSATLTIADGGKVSTPVLQIADTAGSTGTVVIGAPLGQIAAGYATLDTQAIRFGAGDGRLVFNFGGPTYLLGASLNGAGTVDVADGDVVLSSDSGMFTGTTNVTGGGLAVDGLLGGNINISGSGRLTGTGTIGTTRINAGATISPGNDSIGTLRVNGDIDLEKNSTYLADFDANRSDAIHATGKATISDGSVIKLGQVTDLQISRTYTVLTASGGVYGAFGALSSSYAFLDPSLTYDANDVNVTLARNDVGFATFGETRNEKAAGSAVETLGRGNALYDATLGLNKEQAPAAFKDLAGDVYSSITSTLFDTSRFTRTVGIDRLRSAFGGVGAGAGTTYVLGGPASTGNTNALGYVSPDGLQRSPAEMATASVLSDPRTAPAVLWAQAFGGWGRVDGDAGSGSLRNSTGGVMAGIDGPVSDTSWRLGVMGGYSRTDFTGRGEDASGDSDNYNIGLYGGNQWGPLSLRLGALYTRQNLSTRRSVAFSGFDETLRADYDADTVQAFGEVGYTIESGPVKFEPFGNLAYVHVHTDGFHEKGGAAALSSDGTGSDITFTTIGLRSSTDFTLDGVLATAHGSLGWRHAFGDVDTVSSFSFSGSSSFDVIGTAIDRDAAVLDAGVDFRVSPKTAIGVTYSGDYASKAISQTVKANLAIRF